MRKVLCLPLMCTMIISACSSNPDKEAGSSTFSESNPFAAPSALEFHAPAFNKISDGDFKPALEEGMRRQMLEIDSIVKNGAAPTFENTILALEKSGQLLSRVRAVFGLLTQANSNATLLKIKEEEAPKLAANSDAIYLNSALFARVEKLYNTRTGLKLDGESLRLLELYYERFVLAGAKLSEADKGKLKELNKEEATLSTQFTTKLQAANKDLQNTTQQPGLLSMSDREARKTLFMKAWNRAENNDANDTRKIILRIAAIRAEQAALLGYKNYASWKLQDQMAKTPEAVERFLAQVVPAATAKARAEAAEIQAQIDKQKGGFKLEAWDWDYYAEQVRKEKYNLDEKEVKPYFELNKVLLDGVFYAANQLYGLSFKERKDLPVYQDDVRVFDVIDKDGSKIALFYCDYFKRDNKDGGAWMDNFVPQSRLLGTKPVIYNVCNFEKPKDGEPALISFDDVTTMFHEFGHALHGIFADQQYVSISGTNVARDYVEFPSQFNEHWASDPKVLKNYARHYKTGQAIPQSLLDKIKNASSFNQGYAFTEQLAAASLDMQWHTIGKGAAPSDVDAFENAALKNAGLNLSYVPPRYRSSYFLHIWSNGYAAGYYAYSWTSMLEHDAYSWFEQHGGLTRENGQRFRDMILSKGNTEDLAKMFKDFRGQDPDIKPMLKNRGLL